MLQSSLQGAFSSQKLNIEIGRCRAVDTVSVGQQIKYPNLIRSRFLLEAIDAVRGDCNERIWEISFSFGLKLESSLLVIEHSSISNFN